MNQHPVLQERLPCALIGRGRPARLNCVAADAVSWLRGSIEIEISPARRGLTAARFKPTQHLGVDTTSQRKRPANRSGACPHRCAVAALRHNVALCAPSRVHGACEVHPLPKLRRSKRRAHAPLFASPHNTRYVFGRQCFALGPALMHCGVACVHTHPRSQARAHSRVASAPTWLAVACVALRVEIHPVFVTAAATRSAS